MAKSPPQHHQPAFDFEPNPYYKMHGDEEQAFPVLNSRTT